MIRLALLYPTPDAAEDDFIDLAARCDPPAEVVPVHFPWPDGVGDLSALGTEQTYAAVRELGSDAHLERVIPALDGFDAAIFAVTSASFLHGEHGVGRQLRTLRRLTGRPTVSTTSAFQHAVRRLGLTRVALASVYHPSASAHFVRRLAEAGATTVGRVDADAPSDRELAGWTADRIEALVRSCRHDEAQAVVLPETALHTAAIADRLDEAAGRPVLTATQVSVWAAYDVLGQRPRATNAGVLFGRPAACG
ncbi:Maleate cis-trans isomerase [Amycolatopsis pretoriensis]|uniref:Maleate cis-trans isomerase n=1 Tax=Amycolatopsis pretoriensis TaxID=218821 RepID=A0A1H5QLY6_9PSEU|nr:Maleate cis-trans isomerase [Amycolatopsis pretoriensis]